MTKFIRKYSWAGWMGAGLGGFFGVTVSDPYFWIFTFVLTSLVMIRPCDSEE
jgi:uncharacterized membrane protein